MLVLSLFSGVGLLDQAFREKGFCVVSAGDLITGQDIREFRGIKGKFNGVIGGSPCQDFSGLKREKGDYSLEMMYEFLRVVGECEPDWYLHENVKGVPNIPDLIQDCIVDDSYTHFDIVNRDIATRTLKSYSHQRLDINQGWYSDTSRLRHIQFGSKDELYLDIPRGDMRGVENSCALASDDRSFKELCYLQGLNDDYDLPDFNVAGKKRAVGNGVPLVIGRVLADAVKSATGASHLNKLDVSQSFNQDQSQKQRCPCGCKRVLVGRKKYYDSSCRKRAERLRRNSFEKVTL
jgi:DNA (cytosine-5)-methyltransferase 1